MKVGRRTTERAVRFYRAKGMHFVYKFNSISKQIDQEAGSGYVQTLQVVLLV
jgi:hypothetical protein